MADSKSAYSNNSKHYVYQVDFDKKIERANAKAKRVNKYKSEMKSVDINKIVREFAPNAIVEVSDNKRKLLFIGEKYVVVADMHAGYLRINMKGTDNYIKLDGTISENNNETHFRIRKIEEM